ncbi:hypothetical protein OIU77_001353 [Salix suchowensis]|uniref:C2H2-type domain-containing protein n=1 Tax=Salix suchowensis TaxID=1278906 RepID=A0ABQ9B3C6_9ROSI|nr:hypothetical protein OIU77_001353 [Salix suchowensis]
MSVLVLIDMALWCIMEKWYNELDQPVCRVCDVVLKSEFQWDAHQASRKHIEAVNNIKVNAARLKNANNAKSEPSAVSTGSKHADNAQLQDARSESLTQLPKPQSALPPDFFDNKDAKRLKTAAATEVFVKMRLVDWPEIIIYRQKRLSMPRGLQIHPLKFLTHKPSKDKELFLKASLITRKLIYVLVVLSLLKPDVNDEYKQFEKLIQEDLREVDNRMEEEEVDAAENIEEAESLEQKAYRERVELLKKKKMELMVARASERSKGSEVASKESSQEDSSSDDDSDVNFAVDWRAQHL